MPALHLHGAVGWYREATGGAVVRKPSDERFDNRLSPVVLYPDPAKNPFEDAGVSLIWASFRRALSTATHVVVVGHSLHDRPLLDAIAETEDICNIAFCYYDDEEIDGFGDRVRTVPRLRLQTRRIAFHRCAFGPNGDFSDLAKWDMLRY